jgi:hypothetical protein
MLVCLDLVVRNGHILDLDFGEFPSCDLVGKKNIKLAKREPGISCESIQSPKVQKTHPPVSGILKQAQVVASRFPPSQKKAALPLQPQPPMLVLGATIRGVNWDVAL